MLCGLETEGAVVNPLLVPLENRGLPQVMVIGW